MTIKIAALDVYGTILAADDHDDCFPPRQKLEFFLDECKKRKIKVVTSSDAYVPNLKADLSSTFFNFPERGLSLDKFDDFFCLDQLGGKDYSVIYGYYDIIPQELLVVDDRECHIQSARRHGCVSIHCPEYRIDAGKEWDFSMIDFDEYQKRGV